MERLTPPSLLYLWDRRTFYLGTLEERLQFSHAATTLVVSLDQPMRVRTPAMTCDLNCHSLLLSAGKHVFADTGNAIVANCYLDPFGEDFAALLPRMRQGAEGVYWELDNETECRKQLREIHRQSLGPDALYQQLNQLICPQGIPAVAVDPRVRQVVQLIKDNIAENQAVEDLAQQVNLSVPRLVQLFKQQIGVPIRRYRQWHRLYVTAVGVACGASLTEAAIAAGFTDSAHFSNTFRTMLGMAPSVVLAQLDRVRLFAPPRPEMDASLRAAHHGN